MTRTAMKSYNHRVRNLTEEPPPKCCRSGCEQEATFVAEYEWRAGWAIDRVNTTRMPLCTKHTLEFVRKFKTEIKAETLKG